MVPGSVELVNKKICQKIQESPLIKKYTFDINHAYLRTKKKYLI